MSKQYNNIDDFFRDKFEDFEVDPPEYIWENVKSRMEGGNGNGGRFGLNRGGIAGITLLIIAIGITTLVFLSNSSTSLDQYPDGDDGTALSGTAVLLADNSAEATIDAGEMLPAPAREVTGPALDGKKDKEQKKTRIRGNNPKKNATVILDPVMSPAVPEERVARMPLEVNPVKASPLMVRSTGTQAPQARHAASLSSHNSAGEQVAGNTAADKGADMLRGETTGQGDESVRKRARNDYGNPGTWLIGLHFTPEMITYPSDDQLKNYSYSVELSASRKLGNYFIQSGIGLAKNHDQGNSMIDYNKYLGSYEDVYDVTFDSTQSGIVPVYHTETVHVYDSINHVVVSPTKRYFTYIQVPLFVGYGAESRRFGWFVKAGPSLSFLVSKDIPESSLSDNKARILSIENELPGRISTNWQFILSAGATYKLGQRLSLSMEPMFRYYIQSVYEQDKLNTRHPFSVGLRTGLLLSF